MATEQSSLRRLSDSQRIVVKVGTSTLTHRTGRMNLRRFHNLVRVLADLSNAGKQLILVSSGAVGLGVGQLGLRERPTDTPTKQACAAVAVRRLRSQFFIRRNSRHVPQSVSVS